MGKNDLRRDLPPEGMHPSAKRDTVRGYTIALGVFGLFMLLGALTAYSVIDKPTTDGDSRWALEFVARIELMLTVVAGLVVALRARLSPYAHMATAAFSWFLLFSFPIGTAFFLYWYFKVRPRERPA